MLFLADEDFPGIAVHWLRNAGHDVVWARTHMAGGTDSALLAAAQKDSRVVLTCDKDFGELVYRQRLHHCGVMLVRVDGISNVDKARIVARAIREHEADLPGAFTVIQPGTIRIRRV